MSLNVLNLLASQDPNVFAESIKAYGLEIVGRKETDPLKTIVQSESVASIASAITEDVNTNRDISDNTRRAKQIAERHGFIVKLI